MFSFRITAQDKKTSARLGTLRTPHGAIHTPAFVPVATKAALRGIDIPKVQKLGAEIFMVNTFHLFINGRYKIIEKFGGLHRFMNVDAPLMTDSGGFQIFSLGFGREQGVGKIANIFPEENRDEKPGYRRSENLIRVHRNGIEFKSPRDGKKIFLSPETSMKVQRSLGADIIFAFDECTSPLSDYNYTKKALLKTHNWAIKCLAVYEKYFDEKKQALFGIVQGGYFSDLRQESAKFISELPFFGIGIGGSLGKSKKDVQKILEWIIPLLGEEKPRHLLGIGEVDDIFAAVERGIDLFDCVIPTRLARHGTAFASSGNLDLRKSSFLKRRSSLDPECSCSVCKNYSASYISHLLREKELNGILLLTEHNLSWTFNLMKEIRGAIKDGSFLKLKKEVLKSGYG